MQGSVQTSSETSSNNSNKPQMTLHQLNLEWLQAEYDFMTAIIIDPDFMNDYKIKHISKECAAGALTLVSRAVPYDWRLIKDDFERYVKYIKKVYAEMKNDIIPILKSYHIDLRFCLIWENVRKFKTIFNVIRLCNFNADVPETIKSFQLILPSFIQCYKSVKILCSDDYIDECMMKLKKLSFDLPKYVRCSTRSKHIHDTLNQIDMNRFGRYVDDLCYHINFELFQPSILKHIIYFLNYLNHLKNHTSEFRRILKQYALDMMDYYEKKNEEALQQISPEFISNHDDEDFETEWNSMAVETLQTSIQNIMTDQGKYIDEASDKSFYRLSLLWHRLSVASKLINLFDEVIMNEKDFEDCEDLDDVYHKVLNDCVKALDEYFH